MRTSTPLMAALLSGTSVAASQCIATHARQIYQFPNETFIENVAILSDGRLLLNTFADAQIYVLDPDAAEPDALTVAKIPGINQLSGIAEVGPNVFVVSGGVEGLPFSFINGSALVATVDLHPWQAGEAAAVRIVANVPNTRMLNGMVALPHSPHVVLSVDSIGGRIFRTDTVTGDVAVVFQHELIGPGPEPHLVPLGVNGLEILDGYLYFTNSNLGFFARMEIDEQGYGFGEIEEIYRMGEGHTNAFDDFSMASDGVAYVTSQTDSFVTITPSGRLHTLLDPSSDVKLLSPTSVVLTKDEKTAFVVTGGMEGQGGQVVQVDIRR